MQETAVRQRAAEPRIKQYAFPNANFDKAPSFYFGRNAGVIG